MAAVILIPDVTMATKQLATSMQPQALYTAETASEAVYIVAPGACLVDNTIE